MPLGKRSERIAEDQRGDPRDPASAPPPAIDPRKPAAAGARPASAAPPAIAVHDLGVAYGGRAALAGVSFEVPRGSFVGVLGPNGAGKTTLLRALLGLVPHAGTIELRGSTAYVPQLGAVASAFPVDALGVVLMGRYPRLGWRRRPGSHDRRLALALLEHVGLADRARAPFGSLSGGQRQRVLVARALAQEGDVLLLDEPLAALDSPSAETTLRVLVQECARGRTVLMTTHDLAQARATCDRIVLLNRRLVAHGPTGDIFRPEVLARAYGSELVLWGGERVVVDEGGHHGAEVT
jgi:ABC-type Mn2+/Zn2+ transport system ATPase subunit